MAGSRRPRSPSGVGHLAEQLHADRRDGRLLALVNGKAQCEECGQTGGHDVIKFLDKNFPEDGKLVCKNAKYCRRRIKRANAEREQHS